MACRKKSVILSDPNFNLPESSRTPRAGSARSRFQFQKRLFLLARDEIALKRQEQEFAYLQPQLRSVSRFLQQGFRALRALSSSFPSGRLPSAAINTFSR